MKNVKKAIALVSLAALVCANSTFAADLSLTWSNTNLSLTWTTLSPLSGQQATGSLDVNVSATVLPTLSFSLANNNLSLGDLVVDSYTTWALAYSWVTNAKLWMNVKVQSTNLLKNASWDKIWANGWQAWTSYKFGKDVSNFSAGWTEFNTTLAQELDTIASNWSFSWSFDVWAKIDAATIAWNYTDTLTFTVTWNF